MALGGCVFIMMISTDSFDTGIDTGIHIHFHHIDHHHTVLTETV